MPKKIEQEQNNNQEVNFHNGSMVDKVCNRLMQALRTGQARNSKVSLVIHGGHVTQVVCEFLSRDHEGKCEIKGCEGKDCYFLPVRVKPAARTVVRGKGKNWVTDW